MVMQPTFKTVFLTQLVASTTSFTISCLFSSKHTHTRLIFQLQSYPFSISVIYNRCYNSSYISNSFITMKSNTLSSSISFNRQSALSRSPTPRRAHKHSLSPSPSTNTNTTTTSSSCSSMELRQVFNYFDENRDGKVSPIELQNCVRTLGGELSIEDAAAAVSSSDTDGDGLLGFEDFQKLMESNSSEDEKKEELRQAFRMYETEPGSGFISPMSLKRMLSRLGESRSIDDCKAMIRSFDLNGDGVLCFKEFAIMMR